MSSSSFGMMAAALGAALLLGAPAGASAATSGEIESGAIERGGGGSAGSLLARPGSRPYGKTYGQWAREWVRWAVGTRGARHPLLDAGDCSEGQSGDVWFLGGTFGSPAPVERECSIPAGTALFFPIANEFWLSTPDVACVSANPWYDAGPRDPEWRLFEREILDKIRPPKVVAKLSLSIDGDSAGGLRRFFVRSPSFGAHVPGNNIFDALKICGEGVDIPAFQTRPDATWGYYAFVKPLPIGEHVLRWRAKLRKGVFFDALEQDITYRITVEDPGCRRAAGRAAC